MNITDIVTPFTSFMGLITVISVYVAYCHLKKKDVNWQGILTVILVGIIICLLIIAQPPTSISEDQIKQYTIYSLIFAVLALIYSGKQVAESNQNIQQIKDQLERIEAVLNHSRQENQSPQVSILVSETSESHEDSTGGISTN